MSTDTVLVFQFDFIQAVGQIMLILYLLMILDTGRWILDKPKSKIKYHTSSMQSGLKARSLTLGTLNL
jgi:hypothetical protein